MSRNDKKVIGLCISFILLFVLSVAYLIFGPGGYSVFGWILISVLLVMLGIGLFASICVLGTFVRSDRHGK